MALLVREGLLEANPEPSSEGAQPTDLTHGPLHFPAPRALRLQSLARADEGFLLGLGYSTQRGYGDTHPFLGELRQGLAQITLRLPELDAPITVGRVSVTECQMIQQYHGDEASAPQMTRGYGLVLGQSERKAMAMALVDRALQAQERGEPIDAPAQDQEFVLSHADNVAASGFVEHLKLPHHVDFQTELAVLRTLRRAATAAKVPHEP
jgi:alpha-D-ribose 1-methylphosphonate 5-triphosphate synthase subunit PhnI